MRELNTLALVGLTGGVSRWTCFGLGFAAGVGILTVSPLGWAGAAIALGSAIDRGCFD